ncbi:intermembrane phospholipid transport protein YdbH family protein [Alishewanella tabrizica]|uniref:Dicarboxylate transport domain-containing protein n=1 Tax=Alishewanella tabrizica TaxID=671278 RepID=A0ABQ2WS78_9ALTE|nr:YdbH domain-containing protein [Alishewanella tabrizica]GGW67826.1 hypothetical protein GCM10008111_24900 [Alishewanella tabrizica]
MRRLLQSLGLLLLGLPVVFVVGWFYLQAQLKQAGISEWSIHLESLSLHQLTLTDVHATLNQPTYQVQATFKELQLTWSWPAFFRFKPETLLLNTAQLNFYPPLISTDPDSENLSAKNDALATPDPVSPATLSELATGHAGNLAAMLALPIDWALPENLPRLMQLENVTVTLPCFTTRCDIQADGLISKHESAYWQAKLAFASSSYQVPLRIDLRYEPQDTENLLQASVQLEQQFALSFKQHVSADRNARTDITIALAPPSEALLALLDEWSFAIPDDWISQFNQPIQLFASGEWRVPDTLPAAVGNAFPIPSGDFQLIARAPDAFVIPKIGWLKGDITTSLSIREHQVRQWQLKAELILSHLSETLTSEVLTSEALSDPIFEQLTSAFEQPLAPLHITFSSSAVTSEAELANLLAGATEEAENHQKGENKAVPHALPISIKIHSAAPLQSDITALLHLTLFPTLQLDLQHGVIALAADNLHLPAGATLSDFRFNSALRGSVKHETTNNQPTTDWSLSLSDTTTLSGLLLLVDTQAQLQLQLSNTQLRQTRPNDITVQSQANLTITALTNPYVITQNWRWQSDLTGSLSALALNGELTNDSGITLLHQLQWQTPGQLKLEWQMNDLFLLAGNPLQMSLAQWPPLLTLNRGRLGATGQLQLVDEQLSINALIHLREIQGLYDRTLFNGLTSQLGVNYEQNRITLASPRLYIADINHGLQMGPIELDAQYSAAIEQPLNGQVQLNKLSMQFMQGDVTLAPTLVDLSASEQHLVLVVNQLDLTELVRQHPTNDLYAKGKVSGRIPLLFKDNQFSVQKGSLAAEQPGGQLQYRNAAATAGNSNPGMKLVFDALSDFHFNVLSTEISYDQDGKLLLALQLQGANPAVQQGRAINLTINLEEDLPAMIASLQLTNKLNDTLTKRVQQYIKRQQAAKSAAGETP